MSAAASPGRTWPITGKRRMPTLARATAAVVFRSGDRIARIPDLACVDPSARQAKVQRKDCSCVESFAECDCGWRLDCSSYPVPVEPAVRIMRSTPQLVHMGVLLLLWGMPASAQVEKVAMRTTGISCGICAGLSEIYFRRVPGVDQVKISLRTEAIMLTYKPGAVFDPAAIRKILEPMKVGVVQFQIGARGQVEENGGKRIFVAGRDRFALLDAIDSPEIPLKTEVRVEGILFDRSKPMELKVLTSSTIR